MSKLVAIIPVVENKFTWTDGRLHGGRDSRCWIVTKDGVVHSFRGKPIPTVCSVVGSSYVPNGKWSATTYTVRVGTAVPINPTNPMHGGTWSHLGSWEEGRKALSEDLGINCTMASFQEAMRVDWPNTSARWDAAEKEAPLQ